MAVAVIRRENESSEKLIGRWKKKTQQARIVKNFRNQARFNRRASATKVKGAALVREGYRAERRRKRFYA